MIDIHPPHEAAHSWRDIAIHLATITVGLFIALSLEGCIEWQHHRHLVHEARENIRTEIRDNQKDLQNARADIHKEQAQIKADIETLKALRRNPTAHGHELNLGFNATSLSDASWSTAHETGAFGYMSYPEVKGYAELYDLQSAFSKETDRVTGSYTTAFSLVFAFDDEAAKATMVQDVSTTLQRVYAVQSELLVYDSIAKGLDDEYTHILQRNF